jgi:hypothetical protein
MWRGHASETIAGDLMTKAGDSSHIGRVGTCQQTSVPIDLYGPSGDDIMGLPQYWLPANQERSEGTERGAGGLKSAGTTWSASHYASRRRCRFPQASIGADGPHLEQERSWAAVLLGWPQIRYQRREVVKWFVEQTGPYARCDSECGRAFPLRDFKKVTDQQRGLST